MSNKEDKYYDRIIQLLELDDSSSVERACRAAIVYLNANADSISHNKKEMIVGHLLKDVKSMDDYANTFALEEDEKEVMMYEFEQHPEYVHRYEALAYQLLPNKVERKKFIDKHRTILIDASVGVSVGRIYIVLDHEITKEDANYIAKKLLSKKKKVNYRIIEEFIREVDNKKIELNEEKYDELAAIIVMKELVLF
ncbi:MAG: hypothetical protein K0R18_510 [Bacillales bacterium]|jgi:hypothetical protein|nr:hypothetical protein [Bacillales bacterium]